MRTAIILPYFGKFDSLFPLWLKSCEINSDIDWLVFTDDRRSFVYPENVKFFYMSFDEIRDLIQSKFDFKISLDVPYRLCNFRPAFGHIFEEYLNNYDNWGYCDNDLIFGDVSYFFNHSVSGNKFQFGTFGHLSILPNDAETNELYLLNDAYKIAFSNPEPLLFFDEEIFNKITSISGYQKLSLPIAHFVPRLKNFYIELEKGREWINSRHVFIWNKGHLFRYYLNLENELVSEEYAYIHFLKRPMKIDPELNFDKPVAIVPNRLFNIELSDITPSFINKHNTDGIFWEYWKNSFKPKNLFKRIYYRVYKNKINLALIRKMYDLISDK